MNVIKLRGVALYTRIRSRLMMVCWYTIIILGLT